ncbi:MAG: hypothetical protein J2P52_03405, partial [Blastocatellia bacterium]|nr:hypothetical protein [Blastocatellia bacterium]
MSVKGMENLRRILLIVLFGALASHLAISAIGQSEHARLAPQTQRPADGQARPAPKPAPTPATAQSPNKNEPLPAQERDETIKINSSLVAVPVSVTNASGEPVRNLTADDFQVETEWFRWPRRPGGRR